MEANGWNNDAYKTFCWKNVILLLESAESIFKFILFMFIKLNYLIKRKKSLGI